MRRLAALIAFALVPLVALSAFADNLVPGVAGDTSQVYSRTLP